MKTITKTLIFLLCLRCSFIVSQNLQTVFSDNKYQLVAVAVSKTGRTFISYPYWTDEHKYSVVELMADGSTVPYPDESWNSWKEGDDGKNKWVCAQALYIDDNNYLWVVDPASPMEKGVYRNSHKAVQFDLNTNTPKHIYYFAGITDDKSYMNDIRVDVNDNFAYFTNSSEGALVVLNLNTGNGREVLRNTQSTMADSNYVFKIDDKQLIDSTGPKRMNADGIAISPDYEWLYYKCITDKRLFRISTKALRDASLSSDDLAKEVHYLGDVCTTDGMIMDKNGFLYLGDIENKSIVRYDPRTGQKTNIITNDARLSWPDTYSITTDGWFYIACSQIHLMPKYNNGVNLRNTPYEIYKIKIPAISSSR